MNAPANVQLRLERATHAIRQAQEELAAALEEPGTVHTVVKLVGACDELEAILQRLSAHSPPAKREGSR